MSARLSNWEAFARWMSSEEFRELLWPRAHPEHIRRHRAKVISERVRMVAWAFAVLTPAWILVDLLVFDWPVWGQLAALRMASAVVFYLIATHAPERRPTAARSALMLMALLSVPPVFYLLSIPMLSGIEGGVFVSIVSHAYSLLPLIVVAGLSLFPLTVLEVVLASTGVFGAVMLGAAIGPGLSGEDLIKGVWLVGLVIGASCLSCMSQLNYMVTLVAQAIKDPLTGAFNRRSGSETLDLQFQISCRAELPLTVAFIDVDNFKRINDTFGHETGDDVLRDLADTLKACLRQSDQLVRWGGEEFVIIMPNSNVSGFIQVLERLRAVGLGKTPDGHVITASIGVSERMGDDCHDWDKLIDVADRRMYTAKSTGKNKCVTPGGEHQVVTTPSEVPVS